MLKKRKATCWIFCFHKSQKNNANCIVFIFWQLPQCGPNSQNLTPNSNCCLTRQPPRFACVLQVQIFFLHCSLMHRQANRSQWWNSKTSFIIALKCFRSFVHHTVQICGSIAAGRSEAVRMTMHRYQIYNFRFQLLRQKIVSAYNIAAVYCNSHVEENMLSSNRFTSIQGKTTRLSEFRVSLQNFKVSFWHQKTA